MNDIPEIHDFRPLDPSFICFHPCKRDAHEAPRHCSHAVNQDDKISADILRSEIMVHDSLGIERLVHIELNQYRRECTTCTRRLECGAMHTECFEIEGDKPMAVMENWALGCLMRLPTTPMVS